MGWLLVRVALFKLYVVSALSQVRIQPSAYDHDMPTLEALVGVPQPPSEGVINHTWSVQMVSTTQKRAK